MKKTQHLFLCMIVAVMSLALVATGSNAQRQNGLPLDNFQFKMTHNSYQRHEDMDDQIDNYNVWGLELDLQWESDCGNPGCITVDHCCTPNECVHLSDHSGEQQANSRCTDCPDPPHRDCGLPDPPNLNECGGEQRLSQSLVEIMRSTEINNRVTFIWLDIKDSGGTIENCCHERWPSNRRDLIRDAVVRDLGGEANIYTKRNFDEDFRRNDGHWPSWQELRDRGKKFILVLEDKLDDCTGTEDDDILFIAVQSLCEAKQKPHARFISIEGGNTDFGSPMSDDHRHIYRSWGCDWNAGVRHGFNLVATNDVDRGDTITDQRLHSPQPMYVNPLAFDGDRLWGTKKYPINQLPAAITRATAGTTLRVRPFYYFELQAFDKPIVLEKDPRYDGSVVIRRP